MYRNPDRKNWQGRIDSLTDSRAFRLHQIIRLPNDGLPDNGHPDNGLTEIKLPAGDNTKNDLPRRVPSIALLGFACDRGVIRNQGIPGAADGPDAIRRALASLPRPGDAAHTSGKGNAAAGYASGVPVILDAGTIVCPQEPSGALEEAQDLLAGGVRALREAGFFVIVLGGGHETAWGHFAGLTGGETRGKVSPPSILNIDAHLDLRPDRPGTSGTPFDQAAELCRASGLEFRYLAAGIQDDGNTVFLRKHAKNLGASWVNWRELERCANTGRVPDLISTFIRGAESVYLSIDLDAFSSAYAPGVSAASPMGISPMSAMVIIDEVMQSGKLVSMDVVELLPEKDKDSQTAKLAAKLIWQVVAGLLTLSQF